jgi:hypothetical protein
MFFVADEMLVCPQEAGELDLRFSFAKKSSSRWVDSALASSFGFKDTSCSSFVLQDLPIENY